MWFLFSVLLYSGTVEFCCVVSVLFCCVVLHSFHRVVFFSCVTLCCVVLCCILCIVQKDLKELIEKNTANLNN